MAELNVRPADLLEIADQYGDLAQRCAVITPRAVEEVNRILETHGPMGFPVAVGIAAGLGSREPQVAAKAAEFTEYATRFTEHAATYTSQDQAFAGRIEQVDFTEDLTPGGVKQGPSGSSMGSDAPWKPGMPRRMPFNAGPGGLGPAPVPGDPYIEVGPRSGIFVPKNELPGVKVLAPGELGPAVTGDGGTYIELVPGSGVWAPKNDFPQATFQPPGAQGPAMHREWLPGIWLPYDQVR